MAISIFSREASHLLDPRWEKRTEVEKSAWQTYVQSHNEVVAKYETAEKTARLEYQRNRRGCIRAAFKPASLWQMLYPWPTDEAIADFDKSEIIYFKEYEKLTFHAAQTYAKEERDARFQYWAFVDLAAKDD